MNDKKPPPPRPAPAPRTTPIRESVNYNERSNPKGVITFHTPPPAPPMPPKK